MRGTACTGLRSPFSRYSSACCGSVGSSTDSSARSGGAGRAGGGSSPAPKPPSARQNDTCSTVASGWPLSASEISRAVTTSAPLPAPLSTTRVTRVRLRTSACAGRGMEHHAVLAVQDAQPVDAGGRIGRPAVGRAHRGQEGGRHRRVLFMHVAQLGFVQRIAAITQSQRIDHAVARGVAVDAVVERPCPQALIVDSHCLCVAGRRRNAARPAVIPP